MLLPLLLFCLEVDLIFFKLIIILFLKTFFILLIHHFLHLFNRCKMCLEVLVLLFQFFVSSLHISLKPLLISCLPTKNISFRFCSLFNRLQPVVSYFLLLLGFEYNLG